MGGLAQAYGDNVPVLYFPGGPALTQRTCPEFLARTHLPVSR